MRNLVKKGLVAAGLVAVLSTGVIVGRATADQPHMHNALDALKQARAELEMSVADKGGHRVAAIEATERAIRETRAGIDYAR
jgi:hypothetical protein